MGRTKEFHTFLKFWRTKRGMGFQSSQFWAYAFCERFPYTICLAKISHFKNYIKLSRGGEWQTICLRQNFKAVTIRRFYVCNMLKRISNGIIWYNYISRCSLSVTDWDVRVYGKLSVLENLSEKENFCFEKHFFPFPQFYLRPLM